MIDWTTVVLKFVHSPINSGMDTRTDRDGVILREIPLREQARGSFDDTINIRSQGYLTSHTDPNAQCTELYLDGNPSKFLQGHNVCGSDDLIQLILLTVERLSEIYGFEFDSVARQRILDGDFVVYRIDINYMFDVGSVANVRAFIDAVANKSRTRSGRATTNKGTAYVNKHSRRWGFKFYSKFDEVTKGGIKHKLNHEFLNSPLLEWCASKVRAEAVIRQELPRFFGVQTAHDVKAYLFTPETIFKLFSSILERIDMSAQTINVKDLNDMPTKLKGTYQLWKQGFSLMDYLSRPTFYRHKKQLKQDYNIDISLTPDVDTHVSNVVPLVRLLEARPAEIPQEFFEYRTENGFPLLVAI